MVYLWTIPDNFLNKDIGEYNNEISPDKYLLLAGRKLDNDEFGSIPVVEFEINQKRVLSFDCLPNNTLNPLVNHRIKLILESIAPNDIQFLPAKLSCRNGALDGYYFLNVVNTITGLDHEKSIYSKMLFGDAISGFHFATYKENCMGSHELSRDKEYLGHLLVTEKVKSIFNKEKITGVEFVRPEDFYRPVTAVIPPKIKWSQK